MPKIMVVDDQTFIRQILRKQLEQMQDVSIVEAANGSEAVGILKGSPTKPDLILLDLVMPIADGFHVLREMAQDPALFSVPVIVVSSHASQENITEATKHLGAVRFIDKMDLNSVDFLGVIQEELAKHA